MLQRILSVGAALAVVLFVGPAVAADKAADKDTTKSTSDSAIQGTLENVAADSITVTDKNGKEHKMMVDTGADVTCDGKECKLSDLKKGVMVRVTAKSGEKGVASRIEATTSAATKDKSESREK